MKILLGKYVLLGNYEIQLLIDENGLLEVTAWHSKDDYCNSVLSATMKDKKMINDYNAKEYFETRLNIENLLANPVNTLYDCYKGSQEMRDALINTLEDCIAQIEASDGQKKVILRGDNII